MSKCRISVFAIPLRTQVLVCMNTTLNISDYLDDLFSLFISEFWFWLKNMERFRFKTNYTYTLLDLTCFLF
jgi:hypothetical protein